MRDILLDELAKGADAAWRLALDSAVASARGGLLALLGARARPRPPWVCGGAATRLRGTLAGAQGERAGVAARRGA